MNSTLRKQKFSFQNFKYSNTYILFDTTAIKQMPSRNAVLRKVAIEDFGLIHDVHSRGWFRTACKFRYCPDRPTWQNFTTKSHADIHPHTKTLLYGHSFEHLSFTHFTTMHMLLITMKESRSVFPHVIDISPILKLIVTTAPVELVIVGRFAASTSTSASTAVTVDLGCDGGNLGLQFT